MLPSPNEDIDLEGATPHFLTRYEDHPIFVLIPPEGLKIKKIKKRWVLEKYPTYLMSESLLDGDKIRFDVQAHIDSVVESFITQIVEEIDGTPELGV